MWMRMSDDDAAGRNAQNRSHVKIYIEKRYKTKIVKKRKEADNHEYSMRAAEGK